MTHTLSPTLDHTAPEAAHPHPHHDTGFNTTLGFWLYLMSDCLIFAVLFATFGVLSGSTAGGPAAGNCSSCRSCLPRPCCCWSAATRSASPC